jgi:hypothetical protein
MRKVTSLLLFMAIAGCATTNRGTVLHMDATSVPTFAASVHAFQQNLRPDRRLRFEIALQEIWSATEFQAGAESSVDEKTKRYFAQLDGLGYDQIINLAGPAAQQTYAALVVERSRERVAGNAARGAGNPGFSEPSWPTGNSGGSNYAGQFPAWIAY